MIYSSTVDAVFRTLGPARGFSELRKAGFEACDYDELCSLYRYNDPSGVYALGPAAFEKFFAERARMAKEAGIAVGQTHAPFPTWPESQDKKEREAMFEALKKAIAATAVMGAPYIVMHAAMPKGWEPETDWEGAKKINEEIFAGLIPVAEEYGVSIALENMPLSYIPSSTPEMLCSYIDSMHSDRMVACLDTGHANITEIGCGDFVRALGKRLRVLHIHDNRGLNKAYIPGCDQHTCPYQGTVDWKDFSHALKEIGYPGTISSEASLFLAHVDPDWLPRTLVYLRETMEYIMSL